MLVRRRFRHFGVGGIVLLCLAASCSGSPDAGPDDSRGGSPGGSGGSHSGDIGGFAGEVADGGKATTANGGTSSGGTFIHVGVGGAGGDPGIGEECARSTAKAEPVPANLLFVIDSSGSMNCNPPDGDAKLGARCARFPVKEDASRPSKWEVTKLALSNALAGLIDRPKLQAGLSLFPIGSQCGVSAAPSVPIAALDAAQLSTIEAALDAVAPDGETPVAGATILSYAHLADELRAGRLAGNSFVILLTDGSETCAPSVLEPLVSSDVPNARLFDIRTFVIGAPGSEAARGLLSRVAWEGGTESAASCDHASPDEGVGDCHFDMTASADFEAGLAAALDQISRVEQIACVLEVPKNPDGGEVDLERVNVTFIPQGGPPERIVNDSRSDCADGADGWQYSSDRSQILLCGSACTNVREQAGELEIVLGCPTEIVR
jgi:hypothetical protein